jgi:hypothetical protein
MKQVDANAKDALPNRTRYRHVSPEKQCRYGYDDCIVRLHSDCYATDNMLLAVSPFRDLWGF